MKIFKQDADGDAVTDVEKSCFGAIVKLTGVSVVFSLVAIFLVTKLYS